VRRRGYSKEDAEDLTQGFFANLLETNCLRKADPDRGRFRTFLRKCLDNFLANDWNKRKAAKRGGNCFFVSWSELGAEERYGQEPSDSLAADKLYDRRWVQALLEKVMAELRQEYLLSGKENRFMALQGCLSGASREESCQVLAEKLQMTEAAVKMERLRLRRRFAELLRLKIAETVEDANQLDAEFQCLFSIWD
jgi:RNA polymerase sigma-70 factor (ECF subfamily)